MTQGAIQIECNGEQWQADLSRSHDLSIALEFDGAQPSFFAASSAAATPYRVGAFAGRVAVGDSCNCSTLHLTPHCNGTHTECVGHITADEVSVRDISSESLLLAELITITPILSNQSKDSRSMHSQDDDLIISEALVQQAMREHADGVNALIVRTLPNELDKRQRRYNDKIVAPYFSTEAMTRLVSSGIDHLVVDLPSVDRADDGGQLAAHRIFWGLALKETNSKLAQRRHATITEFAFIDNKIPDGQYLLNLQVAPFATDAAPSRPVIYPLSRRPAQIS